MGLLAERAAIRTGALEKRDPLPVGRYWIDVLGPKQHIWNGWLHAAGVAVQVISTEETAASGGNPAVTWYLFNVNQPVHWGVATDLGWPTIAGKNISKQSDTTTARDSLEATNKADKEKWGWVPWAVGGTIAVAGLFAVAKLVRG